MIVTEPMDYVGRCAHVWRPAPQSGARTERCTLCRATLTRDARGQVDSYLAGLSHARRAAAEGPP